MIIITSGYILTSPGLKTNKMIFLLIYSTYDYFRTQEMCNEAVSIYPYLLEYVPDQYKTHEICNKSVAFNPLMLEHVPDWFVTQ